MMREFQPAVKPAEGKGNGLGKGGAEGKCNELGKGGAEGKGNGLGKGGAEGKGNRQEKAEEGDYVLGSETCKNII